MHHEFLPQYCNITMKLCANYTKQFVKFGQMWRFCSLFSSIAMGWCIMNFCKKVVRSIRYTALKFCADCAKQFVRNAQNCGKTSHGICTMIRHQLTYWCLCVSFRPKTKSWSCLNRCIHRTWAPADFFLFPELKTPMKGKRFAAIEKIKEKTKQEQLAIPKSLFQKCFENWKKCWYMCIMNSCHKVVRSLRNTMLKLCADCEKQFVRNAQNCGKGNHGFCTMIRHQLTYWWLCVSFWPKTKP